MYNQEIRKIELEIVISVFTCLFDNKNSFQYIQLE